MKYVSDGGGAGMDAETTGSLTFVLKYEGCHFFQCSRPLANWSSSHRFGASSQD